MSTEVSIPEFFKPIADDLRTKIPFHVQNVIQLSAFCNYIYRNHMPPVVVANDAYSGFEKSLRYMKDNPDQCWYAICKGTGTRSGYEGWSIIQIVTRGTLYLDGTSIKSTTSTLEYKQVWGLSKESDRYWGPSPVTFDEPLTANGDIDGNWSNTSFNLSINYYDSSVDICEFVQYKDLLISTYNSTYKKLFSPVTMAYDILTI